MAGRVEFGLKCPANRSALLVDRADPAEVLIVGAHLGKALRWDHATSGDPLKKRHDVFGPLGTTKADQQHRVDTRHKARLPLAKRR